MPGRATVVGVLRALGAACLFGCAADGSDVPPKSRTYGERASAADAAGGAAGGGGTATAATGDDFGNAAVEAAPLDAGMSRAPELVDCTKDVDIVFVLDVSGSMIPFFLKLEEEIFVVDQRVRTLELPSEPHYGLVVFVDDWMVDNGGAPHADPASIRDAFVRGRGTAGLGQVNNPLEFNGTFVENSLDALYVAATQFQWRPAATTHRILIHVTDDTFWEGPPAMPGLCDDFPVDPAGCKTKGSAHSYDEVVELLRASEIWTFAFAAKERRLGVAVDTQPGFFTPYHGRATIPESTGGTSWDIELVLDDVVSLADSISGAVIETQCELYPPPPPPPD